MTRRTFGGGLDVAMCCDLRIAGAARFFNGGHRWVSGMQTVGIGWTLGSHSVDIGSVSGGYWAGGFKGLPPHRFAGSTSGNDGGMGKPRMWTLGEKRYCCPDQEAFLK